MERHDARRTAARRAAPVKRSLVAALVVAGCATSPAPVAPPPSTAVVDASSQVQEAPLDDAACMRCHPRAAHEWERSAHRFAFTSEIFQAEWRPHHQASCVRCHAPLADAEAPEGDAAANGISCVVCHVREGGVLATSESPDAPHPIVVDATLASVDACARCHDFRFESVTPTPYDVRGLLQGTVHEWRAVEDRGSCQSCHMRATDGRVSHGFPGPRDEALLAQAISVEVHAATSGATTRVTLSLESRAGHAVPTGDMFRRLEIEAWVEGRPSARTSSVLMRRFGPGVGGIHEVGDDRVPADASRTVELSLPRARRVGWRVTWLALDADVAHARWLPDEDVRRVVAEGLVIVGEGAAQ